MEMKNDSMLAQGFLCVSAFGGRRADRISQLQGLSRGSSLTLTFEPSLASHHVLISLTAFVIIL